MQTDRPVSRRDLFCEPDVNKDYNETQTKKRKSCSQSKECSEKVSCSLIILVGIYSHETARWATICMSVS